MNNIQLQQHTIDIFERLCRFVPPLVPDELQIDMSNALEQLQDNLHLPIEDIEQTVIVFAKKLWPYRRAFWEFYRSNEGEVGEKIFLTKLTPTMKKKYKLFLASGGQFRDLHAGGEAVNLFSHEEKSTLAEILVDLHYDVWEYTKQDVLSVHKDLYERKVIEFTDILKDIEQKLNALRFTADKEQEHPSLAAEIREQVRAFEQSLAVLGPAFDYEALCNAEEYIVGRREYKNLVRHQY